MRRTVIGARKAQPKLDANGDPIPGRFVAAPPSEYVPRILRGAIELPHEQKVRAKAEAKRKRKAERRKRNA